MLSGKKSARKKQTRPQVADAIAAEVSNSMAIQQAMIDERRESSELFCICKQPYDSERFMIGCDRCDGWFHAKCVNVSMVEAQTLTNYVCPNCSKKRASRKKESGSGRHPRQQEGEDDADLIRNSRRGDDSGADSNPYRRPGFASFGAGRARRAARLEEEEEDWEDSSSRIDRGRRRSPIFGDADVEVGTPTERGRGGSRNVRVTTGGRRFDQEVQERAAAAAAGGNSGFIHKQYQPRAPPPSVLRAAQKTARRMQRPFVRRPTGGEDIRIRLEDKSDESSETGDDSEVFMTTDSELEAPALEDELLEFMEKQRSEEDRFGMCRTRWETFSKVYATPLPHPFLPEVRNSRIVRAREIHSEAAFAAALARLPKEFSVENDDFGSNIPLPLSSRSEGDRRKRMATGTDDKNSPRSPTASVSANISTSGGGGSESDINKGNQPAIRLMKEAPDADVGMSDEVEIWRLAARSVSSNDYALLTHMRTVQDSIDCSLLRWERKQRVFRAALAFSLRSTLMNNMQQPVTPVLESPLFTSNPTSLVKKPTTGGNRDKGLERTSSGRNSLGGLVGSPLSPSLASASLARSRMKNSGSLSRDAEETLWIDVFTCRGCLGHIPSNKWVEHVVECADACSVETVCKVPLFLDGGFSSLHSTVCGCPLEESDSEDDVGPIYKESIQDFLLTPAELRELEVEREREREAREAVVGVAAATASNGDAQTAVSTGTTEALGVEGFKNEEEERERREMREQRVRDRELAKVEKREIDIQELGGEALGGARKRVRDENELIPARAIHPLRSWQRLSGDARSEAKHHRSMLSHAAAERREAKRQQRGGDDIVSEFASQVGRAASGVTFIWDTCALSNNSVKQMQDVAPSSSSSSPASSSVFPSRSKTDSSLSTSSTFAGLLPKLREKIPRIRKVSFRFCTNSRMRCETHLHWEQRWRADLARRLFNLRRRAALVETDVATVLKRVQDSRKMSREQEQLCLIHLQELDAKGQQLAQLRVRKMQQQMVSQVGLNPGSHPASPAPVVSPATSNVSLASVVPAAAPAPATTIASIATSQPKLSPTAVSDRAVKSADLHEIRPAIGAAAGLLVASAKPSPYAQVVVAANTGRISVNWPLGAAPNLAAAVAPSPTPAALPSAASASVFLPAFSVTSTTFSAVASQQLQKPLSDARPPQQQVCKTEAATPAASISQPIILKPPSSEMYVPVTLDRSGSTSQPEVGQ